MNLKLVEVYKKGVQKIFCSRNLFHIFNVHAADALASAGSVTAAALAQNSGNVGSSVIADSLLSKIETLEKHRVNLEGKRPGES